ncbi:MAG: hypothetical protein HeimC2_42470 [Candidatus Heimdallarchaeota archaeon LC_2]|nr:MAG: hypothetical protein HeimC2_42470 [Candidatus Heimdallarchaeota archaeon LC_2]
MNSLSLKELKYRILKLGYKPSKKKPETVMVKWLNVGGLKVPLTAILDYSSYGYTDQVGMKFPKKSIPNHINFDLLIEKTFNELKILAETGIPHCINEFYFGDWKFGIMPEFHLYYCYNCKKWDPGREDCDECIQINQSML